jgi:hypothetical protein
VVGSCRLGNEPSRSVEGGKFLCLLSDYLFFMKDAVTCHISYSDMAFKVRNSSILNGVEGTVSVVRVMTSWSSKLMRQELDSTLVHWD